MNVQIRRHSWAASQCNRSACFVLSRASNSIEQLEASAASMHELVGAATTTVLNKMEEAHRKRCSACGERPAPRPALKPLVTTICWWRARLARVLDVNHLVLIPNRVVEALAFEAPRSGRGVLCVMRGWTAHHREKHHERLTAVDATAPARNTLAAPLDWWEPGWLMWATAWHLGWTICRATGGRFPTEVRVSLYSINMPCAGR